MKFIQLRRSRLQIRGGEPNDAPEEEDSMSNFDEQSKNANGEDMKRSCNYRREDQNPDGIDVLKMATNFKWPGRSHDLGGGKWKLATTRMESCDAGAEYGIFVDVEAKERPITITGIRCASHGLANKELAFRPIEQSNFFQSPLEGLSDPFSVSVYMCEGSSAGKELDRSAWALLAWNETVQLPRVNGHEDWDAEYREDWIGENAIEGEWVAGTPAVPKYGDVPFKPVLLKAGERRGFLIHSSCEIGIANRWPIHQIPNLGDVSDQDKNIRLYCMRAMPEEEPFTEERDEVIQQCPIGLAQGVVEPLEPDWVSRRREGHCFLGEIVYTVC